MYDLLSVLEEIILVILWALQSVGVVKISQNHKFDSFDLLTDQRKIIQGTYESKMEAKFTLPTLASWNSWFSLSRSCTDLLMAATHGGRI